MKTLALCAGVAGLLAGPCAHAVEFRPKLEAEARGFWQAPDARVLGSVAGTVETFVEWHDGARVIGEFFARYDENDDARTHEDVRELYYQVIADDLEVRLGARRVYWGVTESRHLVDVINQSDFVEDVDNETKLGQPMMNLALIRDFGTLDLFLMPYQRARTFPGAEGYPRLPFPVHAHEAMYQSRRGQHHLDTALRYVGTFGPLDLGLAWFDGTAREPRLLGCLRRGASGEHFEGSTDGPICGEDEIRATIEPPAVVVPGTEDEVAQQIEQEIRANLVLVPFYDRLRQASIDAQVVAGSLALKLEALWREQHGARTAAAVAGFEYTFGDVGGSGADVGLLGEYLYDERNDALNVLVDDEIFIGSRLALNDVPGTQMIGGVIASREDFANRLYYVEASRRLGDDWKLSLETRMFSHMREGSFEAFLADQDYATLTLERYF